MYRSPIAPAPRKGVILLVVLALLTLFTIVGISFVLYADSAALQARNAKDANANNLPNMEPEECLSLFLDQFIFDVCDDSSGVYSSLRGHSLSRNEYGFNYTLGATPGQVGQQTGNATPFIGIGRLHYAGPAALGNDSTLSPAGLYDDYKLVNYMYYQTLDGFLRDPECYGSRTGLSAPRGPYAASANVPYTYPDLNNFYLGAIDSYGNLITPSFHREWLFGRLDDQNNPNWTNAVGKYLTTRPRPLDNTLDASGNPLFPYPVDRGGDVKNLIGYPGGCDSSWMDIGAPVLTTSDGRRYKMLVAPLIVDLDGRINLHTAGNIMGAGTPPTHASLMGLGPWEVNLSSVLAPAKPASAANEWVNLYTGTTQPTIGGKYGLGAASIPVGNGTNTGPTIPSPHSYGQLSYRAAPQFPLPMPTANINAQKNLSCFPGNIAGYDNAVNSTAGLVNHPLLYNYYAPNAPNRRFRLSNMERFLRWNDTGFEAMTSELEVLLPNNFNSTNASEKLNSVQRRILVTPISGDLNQPGISPYIWDPSVATYIVNPALVDHAPVGTPPVFPPLPPQQVPKGSDFTTDWRSAIVATNGGNPWNFNNNANVTTTPLPRLDLNYPFPGRTLPANISTSNPAGLTPYPTATDPTLTNSTDPNLPAPNQRFDTDQYFAQFQQAQKDRQHLARQIYLRLLAVSGLSPSGATANAPTAPELQPRRWLAQLAVNMVDYIDNDDISTPFNFYTLHDANPGVANPNPSSFNVGLPLGQAPGTTALPGPTYSGASPTPDNYQTPAYWVFGTELPRVVINEVLMQYQQPPTQLVGNANVVPQNQTFTNNVWVELYNPMELKPSTNPNVSGADTQPVLLGMPSVGALNLSQSGSNGIPQNAGAYAAYRLLVADQNMLPKTSPAVNPPIPITPITDNNNVLGLPSNIRGQTTDADFATKTVLKITDIGTQNWNNTDQANPVYLSPQGFLLVTPPGIIETTGPTANAQATIAPNQASGNTNYPKGLIPANGNGNTTAAVPPNLNPVGSPPNLVLQTSSLQFTSTVSQAWDPTSGTPMRVTPQADDNMLQGNGATVMLQRLSNPHIPWNPNPILSTGAVNPWYNPYVTIDYISNIPLYNASNPFNVANPQQPPSYSSVGKKQPYAGFMFPGKNGFKLGFPPNPGIAPSSSVVQNQTQVLSTTVKHTFGAKNNPSPSGGFTNGACNWLTQLDRMLVSPVELLHVSQYQPHQLTQKFMLADSQVASNTYQHAPVSTWYDETTRLYRVFEFFETRDRLAGLSLGNRTTGKININSIWDGNSAQVPTTLLALCDPQAGNDFSVADVQNAWSQLITLRSPNYLNWGLGTNKLLNFSQNGSQVGPTNMALSQVATGTGINYQQPDRPFLGLAPGVSPGNTANYSQFPQTRGINDTIFRSFTGTDPNDPTAQRLFTLTSTSTGTDNPYMNHQLLTKIFNNVTTRSNTFAVFLTVGFFEVKDTTTQPVKLGAEMNASEGRAIRHRMFAIIDRTVLPPQPYATKPALFRPGADTTGLVPYWSIIN